MTQILSPKEIEEFMKIKGEIRWSAIKTEAEFVLAKQGEDGLVKLEKTIAELGYPLKYRKERVMDFYPLGLEAINLTVIERLFNYTEKDFQEMGRFEAKASLIIRLFIRYFVSIDNVIKEVPKMWRKNYTVGDLSVTDFNKEEKHISVRLENFSLTPIVCENLKGFFSSILQMVLGKKVTCEETKCVHKNDEYHEFLLSW